MVCYVRELAFIKCILLHAGFSLEMYVSQQRIWWQKQNEFKRTVLFVLDTVVTNYIEIERDEL